MPMYCDYHMHSHHSFDANHSICAMAEAAAAAGMEEVCFTDHIDFEDPLWADRPSDIAAQRREIEQERPTLPIPVLCGAEVGLAPDPAFGEKSWAYIKGAQPDFIIGSIHVVEGQNAYLPEYFEGRTRAQAYYDYVSAIATAVRSFPQLCVLGHYDFVAKRAPFADRALLYSDAPDAFDSIFRYLAENGKGMEINTSAWLDAPAWGLDVLSRYVELGGEFVTFGSDAHVPERAGRRMKEAHALAKAAGVRYTAAFRQLKPAFIRL